MRPETRYLIEGANFLHKLQTEGLKQLKENEQGEHSNFLNLYLDYLQEMYKIALREIHLLYPEFETESYKTSGPQHGKSLKIASKGEKE